ncbi:MAG: hypothetical protein ACI92B_000956 [Marinobacter maritimus]|jgi:hypothetical protein
MRNAVSIIAFVLLLAGCAASGMKMQQSDIEKIEPGVTTYTDMESMFGAPVGQGYNQNGLLTANWMHIFVGPFGVGTEYQSLAVVFNENKTVRQYNVSNTGRPLWNNEGKE